MPLHEQKPRIEDIKQSSDVRVRISLEAPDKTVPDMTGATGTITFVPRQGGTSRIKTIGVAVDPTIQPQIYADLSPSDSADWTLGIFDAYGDVTAGGKKYRPTLWGRILRSAP